jgi:hypothetical protein
VSERVPAGRLNVIEVHRGTGVKDEGTLVTSLAEQL